MKLIANNFTGFLQDGRKYRIDVKSTNGFVSANLMVEEFGTFWLEDTTQTLCADGYKTYTEALRESLTKMEDKHNLKLIRAELQVAQVD